MNGFDGLPGEVDGLSEEETQTWQELVEVWESKKSRNDLRMQYYKGHDHLQDLGIAIPPSLTHTATVVGWPAKAVDVLAQRSMFDGFVFPDAEDTPFDMQDKLDIQGFDQKYAQAVVSQLIHGVVFWTLVRRGEGKHTPVEVSARTANTSAALWDMGIQRVSAGMAITDWDTGLFGAKSIRGVDLFLPDRTVFLRRDQTDSMWRVEDSHDHGIGRPLMVPMAFESSELQPFGRSRISREVMSLTDSGQRQALRMEVLMEFNTAPQKYLLGAEEDAFGESKWKAYLDEIIAISRDEDGQIPSFGQLPQISPQGAIQYFGHLAARFAGATGLPLTSLGVVQDNPSSAESIYAAKDDLITSSRSLNRGNTQSLNELVRLWFASENNTKYYDLPIEVMQVQARFRNPAMPSVVGQSDAMVKQIAAIPWLADTDVALEELGYDQAQITRLLSQKRRASGGSMLDRVLAARSPEDVVRVDVEPETA